MYQPIINFPHKDFKVSLFKQAAFGHLLTYNTPEALHEKMPVLLSEIGALIVAEGRLDNRTELARQLGLQYDEQLSDGKIISEAYKKWGIQCNHHLKGNWSLAVFDSVEQELFIALSPTGYASLYYYQDETGFYFSSSIKSLIALPNYRKELNELHFIRYLTMWDDTLTDKDTFYKNIQSLPMAHSLTLKNKKIHIQKFWSPLHTSIRKYKNKQDYADEMLELLTRSVKLRLRSYAPVASMLSGGLDSSTVSYIAADIQKKSTTPLHTFSHIPLYAKQMEQDAIHQTRIVDESPFIKAIAQTSNNIHPEFLNSAHYSIINGMTDAASICNFPLHGACNLYWLFDIYRTVAKQGFGTLLSGEGGNGSISFAGIDYLLPFTLKSFLSNPYLSVRTSIVKPLAISYLGSYLNKKRDTSQSLKKYVTNIFLNDAIIEQYGILADIDQNNKELHRYIQDIKEWKSLFIDIYQPRSILGAAISHYYGFELRDPTTDIDLLEYFFSIPNDAFFDEHYNNRMLVKRMMKGKLPDSVLFEKKKGLQSADIVYKVRAQAAEITETIESVCKSPIVNHYMDTRQLSNTWQQYIIQPHLEPYPIQRLLKALQFAMFLQMNFD